MGAGYAPYNQDRFAAHERVLRLCGRPRAVVDVGGSSGYVSRRLAAAGSRVVVLDRDEAAVADAIGAGVEAHVVDLGRDDPPLGDAEFDLMLCMDILEHLSDPASALRRLRRLLRPDGRLIASVPNGANWTLRLSLLAGRWEYRERGLLDRTHLRNFTRSTFHRLMTDAGFVIVDTDVTCPVPMKIGRAQAVAYHIARRLPGLLAYQHIVVAAPARERAARSG